MTSSHSQRRNRVFLSREISREDTDEVKFAFPAATGEEVRTMLRKYGIPIREAAKILDITYAEARNRYRHGTDKGSDSWRWFRFLPDRAWSLTMLDAGEIYPAEVSGRGNTKFLTVRVREQTIPCLAVLVDEAHSDFECARLGLERDADSDLPEIAFGRLDHVCEESPEGHDRVSIISRNHEDHALHGLNVAMLKAHRWVRKNWAEVRDGDSVDLDAIGASDDFSEVFGDFFEASGERATA